jgi:flavin reductase (DIM6/NTAB) family NADH-FMN oxidoreductase RutF
LFPKGGNVKKSLGAKTLLYPTPVLVVGSYDADGRPNVMTAAWGGIACSKPPCVAVSLRAATASHGNIVARKAFTISLPGRKQAAQADYFGLVSGRDTDKFAATALTPVAAEFVDAPYVGEYALVLECALVQTHELGLHTQFIGQIKDVKIDEGCLDGDGRIDVGKLDPIALALEAGGYFALGALIGPAFSIGKVFVDRSVALQSRASRRPASG